MLVLGSVYTLDINVGSLLGGADNGTPGGGLIQVYKLASHALTQI
jgi:hypothetical protein